MWKIKNFLFAFAALLFLFSLPFVFSAPVSDVNISFLNSPAVVGKDLNFQVTWSGGDVNRIYWQFDSDGNVVQANIDTNNYSPSSNFSTWTTASGSWATTSTSATASGAQIAELYAAIPNASNDGNVVGDFEVEWDMDWDVAGDVRMIVLSTSTTKDGTVAGSGLWVSIISPNSLEIVGYKDGVNTVLETQTLDGSTSRRYRVQRVDANTSVFVDGDFIYSTLAFDVNKGTNVVAFYEGTDVSHVGRLENFDGNYAITSEGVLQSGASQTHNFSTGGAKTIYATVQNPDGNATGTLSVTLAADTTAPVIEQFDINTTAGFGITGAINYTLRCTDNGSALIDYNVTNNGVSQYSSSDANNTTVYLNNKVLNTGTNQIRFTCTDASGNSTSDTNSFSGVSALFYLVYADTGIGLTGMSDYTNADINSAFVYSYALDEYIDLFSTGDVNITYSGTGEDGILFTFAYTDPAQPEIVVDFDVGALDSNSIPVCFSKLRPFYEQLVYSTSSRQVKITNATTGCYAGAAYTDYAYEDAFKLSAYTVLGSYTLFYRNDTNSSYALLSLLSGTFAAKHNLDLLILNSLTQPEVRISDDILTVAEQCTISDCNVLRISYKSPENNESVTLSILNGATTLTSTTATGADANSFSFTWNYTDSNVSANYLTLKAVITRADGDTETITELFTLDGIKGFLDPTLAIILAFALFYFIFTLVATRFGLGWVGIIGAIAALAILSAAPGVQFVLLSEAIFITIGVFLFFSWKNETSSVI